MQLTLTAEWTAQTPKVDRLDIAGYLGTVNPVTDKDGRTVYEIIVIADGGRKIITVWQLPTRQEAREAVEATIAGHVAAGGLA